MTGGTSSACEMKWFLLSPEVLTLDRETTTECSFLSKQTSDMFVGLDLTSLLDDH